MNGKQLSDIRQVKNELIKAMPHMGTDHNKICDGIARKLVVADNPVRTAAGFCVGLDPVSLSCKHVVQPVKYGG